MDSPSPQNIKISITQSYYMTPHPGELMLLSDI